MDIQNYQTIMQGNAHSNTSDRYSFIPTSRVVSVLADHGWHPAKIREAGTRIEENKGFQAHLIRFRNELTTSNLQVGDFIPEIVLYNSHMGTSAFKLMAGILSTCGQLLMWFKKTLLEVALDNEDKTDRESDQGKLIPYRKT